jgi:uncharacterized protein
MAETIRVTVAYAEPEFQIIREYVLAAPARLADALAQAALDPAFARVDVRQAAVGIHGQRSTPDRVLEEGDRVEIYRPLLVDPKAMRRSRAAATLKPSKRR